MVAFLSHNPPGLEDCQPDEQATIAEVDWFAPAVAAPGINCGMATDLKCPVFKRDFIDDATGNLWPVEQLSPCKLLSVPHDSHADNLVVLSRFASFLDQVPSVQ